MSPRPRTLKKEVRALLGTKIKEPSWTRGAIRALAPGKTDGAYRQRRFLEQIN
jgi:hypothetical protein